MRAIAETPVTKMPVVYKMDDARRLRYWRLSGVVDPRDVLRRIAAASDDPDFRPDYDVLVIFEDGTELHGMTIETLAEIRTAAIQTRQSREGNRTRKAAMICPDQMAQLVGRLYRAGGTSDPNFLLEYRICTNAEEAGEWLSRDLSDLEMPRYALVGT